MKIGLVQQLIQLDRVARNTNEETPQAQDCRIVGLATKPLAQFLTEIPRLFPTVVAIAQRKRYVVPKEIRVTSRIVVFKRARGDSRYLIGLTDPVPSALLKLLRRRFLARCGIGG